MRREILISLLGIVLVIAFYVWVSHIAFDIVQDIRDIGLKNIFESLWEGKGK